MTLAISCRSPWENTPPVGFDGEFSTMTLVRSVTRGSQVVRGEGEASLLRQVERSWRRADEGHPGLVDGEPRARVDDLIAGIDVGLHRVADRRLGPRRDDHPSRVDLHTAGPGHVGRDLALAGEPESPAGSV